MSIKGSDYRWFKDALERGDLALVKAAAAQLPAVNLEDALLVALLVIEDEPHNAERAAMRWLGRWALESEGPSPPAYSRRRSLCPPWRESPGNARQCCGGS